MGESTNPRATLRFDRRVRLEFRGATITSDAGLLACRELDDALGLTETANECLQESRGGRNVQHRLVGLLRQSVYSRLAGYNLGNFLRRLCLPKAVKHWSLRSVQVKLIKMGGRLVRHSRWLIFQLSEVSVPRRLFEGVLDRIGRLSPAPS